MANNQVEEWNESYNRNENYIFFPKEEVVKFLNRFIKKRTGIDSYKTIFSNIENNNALDFGCGIGRQTILLKEFGFDAFGVDISSVAITKAKELATKFRFDMEENFMLSKELKIPFKENFFNVAICDSVLDSMYFDNARVIIIEFDRVVNGYLYLNLISSENNANGKAEDLIVQDAHEIGTVQSYYNEERIQLLISNTRFKVIQLNSNKTENLITGKSSTRFHIVLSNR